MNKLLCSGSAQNQQLRCQQVERSSSTQMNCGSSFVPKKYENIPKFCKCNIFGLKFCKPLYLTASFNYFISLTSASYLQKVGSFQHIVNVSSIQWQLSTVQEVHHRLQTHVGHANQLHLQYAEEGQTFYNGLLFHVWGVSVAVSYVPLAGVPPSYPR